MENQYIIPADNEKFSDTIAWIRPVLIGALVGFMLMSFQNCQRVAVSDFPRTVNSKATGGPDVDLPIADTPTVPQAQMPNGDVIVPVQNEVKSVYVCPPGTNIPSSAPTVPKANSKVNTSYGSAASYGTNASSSVSSSSSSGGGNYVSINQTGGSNYAYVYQNGTNNHSTITQNGTNNSACVVQVGENNNSAIDQTGQENSASVEQIGGQNSTITQNGHQATGVSHDSAAACNCQLVHCDSANANLDPTCRTAVNSKVIAQ